MRPLTLDYLRPAHTIHWAGLVLLALGAGVLADGVHYQEQLLQETALWEQRVSRLEHTARQRSAKPVELQKASLRTANEVQQARLVLQQLRLPWTQLLAILEAYPSRQVALLAIQPDTRKRTVRISGEARHLKAVLAYLRYLEDSPVLSRVYLQSHEIQAQVPEKPVRFSLLAVWEPRP